MAAEHLGRDHVPTERTDHDEPHCPATPSYAEVLLDVDEGRDRSVIRPQRTRRQYRRPPACLPGRACVDRWHAPTAPPVSMIADSRPDGDHCRRHQPGSRCTPCRRHDRDAPTLASSRRRNRLDSGAAGPPSLDVPPDRRRERDGRRNDAEHDELRQSTGCTGRRRSVRIQLDRPAQRVAEVMREHRRDRNHEDEEHTGQDGGPIRADVESRGTRRRSIDLFGISRSAGRGGVASGERIVQSHADAYRCIGNRRSLHPNHPTGIGVDLTHHGSGGPPRLAPATRA